MELKLSEYFSTTAFYYKLDLIEDIFNTKLQLY